MSQYHTKQRKMLLEFLNSHADEIFSASQVIDFFKPQRISTSSIYRNLAELENLGEIKKLSKNSSREAYYQYINSDNCKDKIHLFCVKCEKYTHLNIEKAKQISDDILNLEGFEINKQNTIVHGICKNCR